MSSYTSPVKVVDDCLTPEIFELVRRYAHDSSFGDVMNPIDGVIYPGVCPEVPPWIERLFARQIAKAMGRGPQSIDMLMSFFRVTADGMDPAPHGAHNDISHGDHSMFFYINDKPEYLDGLAGTSLLSHKLTGMRGQPRSVEELESWGRDANDYDAWKIDEMIFWEPNRMAIYPADRMHRAEPVGGWGADQEDGRLVLIIFFT